jgi:ribosomal protein L11 methyltransferase
MPGMSSEAPSVWTEVSLVVRPWSVEAVAEAVERFTGNGTSIEPAFVALGPDEGYLVDPRDPQIVRGYVYGSVPQARRRSLRRLIKRAGLTEALASPLTWRTIRAEDWAEAWKEHYDIERAGRIVVRPAWREYQAQPGEVVVSLDPGMAFGTGQHPTTRMCLLALQDIVKPGDYVLDLGAGSGVLAIAAVLLGASRALAVDVEEQAVAASIANAALNGVSDRMEVPPAGSLELAEGRAPFDLVLANIVARVISELAPRIAAVLKPGGALITSGIIGEREAETLAALADAGLKLERRLEDGDWRAFVHRRP